MALSKEFLSLLVLSSKTALHYTEKRRRHFLKQICININMYDYVSHFFTNIKIKQRVDNRFVFMLMTDT